MSDKFNLEQKIGVNVNRSRGINELFNLNGQFKYEHYRNNVKIGKGTFPNSVKNVAVNSLWDTMFNAASQVAAVNWCVGLIDNASFSAEANADTMASHLGWIEFTGYSQSTRVAWGQGAAGSRAIVNASAAIFDITASSATLYGIFIASNTTKGGTSGVLWTSGNFPSTVPVVSGDQIKIIYQVAA